MLAVMTRMTLTQVSTWFANARRRLKKDYRVRWLDDDDDDDDDDDVDDNDADECDSDDSEKPRPAMHLRTSQDDSTYTQPDLAVSGRPIIITRHTLVWKVHWLLFFSLSGYRYLGDGGTDRREILYGDAHRSRTNFLPFWGWCLQGFPKSEMLGLNFGHLTANISKTVRRRLTCQLQLKISLTRAF